MTPRNAIEWHTQIAQDFDDKYAKSRSFKERYDVWTALIDKYCSAEFRAIDLGCGSGIFTFYLAQRCKSVTGLDASPAMLNICQKKREATAVSNVDFRDCDFNSMGLAITERADLIVCSSVLEYLDDLDQFLRVIRSSLSGKGLLIFSMPNKRSFYRRLEPAAFEILGRPKYYRHVKNVCGFGEIATKLRHLGFEILESHYYGYTPFLSQLFRRVGLARYSENLFVAVAQLPSTNVGTKRVNAEATLSN